MNIFKLENKLESRVGVRERKNSILQLQLPTPTRNSNSSQMLLARLVSPTLVGKGLVGNYPFEETLDRNRQNSVDEKLLPSAIEDQCPAFRVIHFRPAAGTPEVERVPQRQFSIANRKNAVSFLLEVENRNASLCRDHATVFLESANRSPAKSKIAAFRYSIGKSDSLRRAA